MYDMLKRPAIVIALILFILLMALTTLYIAHSRIATFPNKDAPEVLFWMEVSKQVLQMASVGLGGGIIAGFLKILFDSVQAQRQMETARDQFRKEIIAGFINARYEATAWREKFLNAPSGQREKLYRGMMEDFVVIKEKLSRVWHDVETGKQSLTYAGDIQENVINMKDFFDNMLKEYRSLKDERLADSLDFFLERQAFGDFLSEGTNFKNFLDRYRKTIRLIRLDLLGK